MSRTQQANIRISAAEAKRLEDLAQRSRRTKSDVVRILLSKATPADLTTFDEDERAAEEQEKEG